MLFGEEEPGRRGGGWRSILGECTTEISMGMITTTIMDTGVCPGFCMVTPKRSWKEDANYRDTSPVIDGRREVDADTYTQAPQL